MENCKFCERINKVNEDYSQIIGREIFVDGEREAPYKRKRIAFKCTGIEHRFTIDSRLLYTNTFEKTNGTKYEVCAKYKIDGEKSSVYYRLNYCPECGRKL